VDDLTKFGAKQQETESGKLERMLLPDLYEYHDFFSMAHSSADNPKVVTEAKDRMDSIQAEIGRRRPPKRDYIGYLVGAVGVIVAVWQCQLCKPHASPEHSSPTPAPTIVPLSQSPLSPTILPSMIESPLNPMTAEPATPQPAESPQLSPAP
jgi:hypothetical protein